MTGTHLPQENAARHELAACYRLFDFLGWTEMIFNHITLRDGCGPGGKPHYLINPFGLHYSEVTAANLVKIDVEGNDVDRSGRLVNQAGFVIHGAIHEARDDAHCIMHVHTTAGCAVACKESGLRHDNFYSAAFYGDVAYHDYEGVTTSLEERPRLVKALGTKRCMILRNHGLLVTGHSVPEAFQRLWMLQRACEIQLASDAGLGSNRAIPTDVLERVPATRAAMNVDKEGNARKMFDAMLRKAGIRPAAPSPTLPTSP